MANVVDTATQNKPINHWPVFFVVFAVSVVVVAASKQNFAYAVGNAGIFNFFGYLVLRKVRTVQAVITAYVSIVAILIVLIGGELKRDVDKNAEEIASACKLNPYVVALPSDQQKVYCNCYAESMAIKLNWWAAKKYLAFQTPAPNFASNPDLVSLATTEAQRCTPAAP
ncbi:hypothetical protein [Mesorhizobium sp. M0478]|uniref:hypothetical protein n=1 Tax=Mesorhizobium sp. M0478 TaxID=2956947 RepID=UPI003337E331